MLQYVEPSLRGAVARVAVDEDLLGFERLALCDRDTLTEDVFADHRFLRVRGSEILRLVCDLLLQDFETAGSSDETKEGR